MTGENNNYVNFLDLSDTHDTMTKDSNDKYYLPKHIANAELAKEQKAEFIINKGDNLQEDDTMNYFLSDIDFRVRRYTVQRLFPSRYSSFYIQ